MSVCGRSLDVQKKRSFLSASSSCHIPELTCEEEPTAAGAPARLKVQQGEPQQPGDAPGPADRLLLQQEALGRLRGHVSTPVDPMAALAQGVCRSSRLWGPELTDWSFLDTFWVLLEELTHVCGSVVRRLSSSFTLGGCCSSRLWPGRPDAR